MSSWTGQSCFLRPTGVGISTAAGTTQLGQSHRAAPGRNLPGDFSRGAVARHSAAGRGSAYRDHPGLEGADLLGGSASGTCHRQTSLGGLSGRCLSSGSIQASQSVGPGAGPTEFRTLTETPGRSSGLRYSWSPGNRGACAGGRGGTQVGRGSTGLAHGRSGRLPSHGCLGAGFPSTELVAAGTLGRSYSTGQRSLFMGSSGRGDGSARLASGQKGDCLGRFDKTFASLFGGLDSTGCRRRLR